MAKKKISFDIEEDDFQKIKIILQKNPNLGQGEFLREAVKQMISKFSDDTLTIFVPYDGKIKSFVIEKENFDIELFEASEDMKKIVNATKEGVVKNKKDSFEKNELSELIGKSYNKKINFFIK